MTRKVVVSSAVALVFLGLATTASASAPIQLGLSQGAAFSILGHSCGGIQEKTYAAGFGAHGYPTGNVYMQTRCGGSGRGGGYHVTTYSAWASVVWTWFGETRSFSRLEGPPEANESFDETDAHGDRLYNSATTAWLETGEPPLTPPAPPDGRQRERLRLRSGRSRLPAHAGGMDARGRNRGADHLLDRHGDSRRLPCAGAQRDRERDLEQREPPARSAEHHLSRDGDDTDSEGTSEPSEAIESQRRTATVNPKTRPRTAACAAHRTRARSSCPRGLKKPRMSRASP